MKLLRVALVVAAVFAATTAFAAEHSEGLLGLQITNGTADLYSPGGDGYISAYDHSEVGLGIQYWRLMSKDYAFTFAAGMGTSYSSLSKNYNGTYSAQRQELVEQYGAYGVLSMEFIHQLARPITERFVAMARFEAALA